MGDAHVDRQAFGIASEVDGLSRTQEVWEATQRDRPLATLTLGPDKTDTILHDPRHLVFALARYKFAAKMLPRCRHIVEIGCGEGLGTLMFIAHTSAQVTAIDFDQEQLEFARNHLLPHGKDRLSFLRQDMVREPYTGRPADGLVSIDVIEHIDPREEAQFLQNCMACLEPQAVAVFGTPNIASQQYASKRSQLGHVNLFDADRLVSTLEGHFRHVFLFSMNDEMVHTGFSKMAHYFLALCVR